MEELQYLISEGEVWLVQQIENYAKKHNYKNFMRVPRKARHILVKAVSGIILEALKTHHEPLEFDAGDDFTKDSVASFGIEEAKKHHQRGTSLTEFLAMMMYIRQSYIDLIWQSDFDSAVKERGRLFVERFFDRLEIGLCLQWISMSEEALQQHSEWLRVTLDSIGDAVIATNLEGKVVFMNPVAQNLTGFNEQEALHKPIEEVFHIINEKSREPAEIPIKKVIRDGMVVGLANHTALISKEGVEHSIADSAAPIRNLQGEIIGVVMVFQDITERKKVENALRESEERYRKLVELSPGPMTVNAQGKFLFVNGAAARLLGVQDPGELVGQPVFKYLHPDCHEMVRARVLDERNVFDAPCIELKWIRPDGREVIVETCELKVTYQGQRATQIIMQDVTRRKRTEESLRESEERYRRLVEYSPEAMLVEIKGIIVYANNAAVKLFGAKSQEELVGTSVFNLVHPDHQEIIRERSAILQDGSETQLPIIEAKLVRLDGQVIYTEDVAIPIVYDGRPAVQVVIRDVTQRKIAQDAINQQAAAMTASLDGIAVLDANGRFIIMNEAHATTYGYKKPNELIGKTWHVLYTREDARRIEKEVFPLFLEKGYWRGEAIGKKKDGSFFPQEISLSKIEGGGMVCVVRDITERKQAEEAIRHQAYHDPLTDLPNRMLFDDRLRMAIVHARRNKTMLAVMFLDLDNFKTINDMLGHAMGDQFLLGVTERLSMCLRKEDTVSRLGGDEFTILLPEIEHVEDAARVAEKIIANLSKPWVITGHDYCITASIGIAVYPSDGDDPETLMKHADMAMYRAKEKGNNYQLYTPTMNVRAFERIAMESALRRALEQEEFTVYYQPQIETGSGRIIGMEALVRWQRPNKGIVSPHEFIPLAEETGLIVPIGEWVLKNACRQNKKLQEQGFSPLRVAVNLSAYQFQQRNLVQKVYQALEESGMDPRLLVLEITESVAMQDVDFTIKTLSELREMGIQIAIDDFGTGYSSLSYLKKFPINILKIDRSFVRDITLNPEDAAIVTTLIFLAQNLKLRVVAEGVETEEQLEFLKQKRCNEIQGYLFSRPVPAEEISDLLARN